MKTKICNNREVEKPLSAFHKSKTVRSGLTGRCGDCINERAKELSILRAKPIKIKHSNVKKVIGKIVCLRNGETIHRSKCIPGCNDICLTCEHKVVSNIKASDDTYTAEEEALMRHQGSFGSSGALAANEGIYAD